MAPLNLARLVAGRGIQQPAFHASICLKRLHQSSLLRLPRKDSQDKDSINANATEYSKSGTDDDAADKGNSAFDPSISSPEEGKKAASEGNETNPLEFSPANPELSKERPEQEGGASNSSAENGSDRKQSGHGSPEKGKSTS